MILILTRLPTTHSVAVFSALPASTFTFVSPAPLIRTILHDGPSTRAVPRPPRPRPHPHEATRPTALLLEAVVRQRVCANHASGRGECVLPGRKFPGASPWYGGMPERFGGCS